MGGVDSYSIEDMKRIHGIMTASLVKESGRFRSGAEGVFKRDVCIFMAPPAAQVPALMDGLFAWMKKNKDVLHPLILSYIFHYEFVFIHPFSDGNGRMARLWQTALLYNWRPIFRYIPVESRIKQAREEYYRTIDACNKSGSSEAFIRFMLQQIDLAMDEALAEVEDGAIENSPYVEKLLARMEEGVYYTTKELLERLGLSSRETLRRNYIRPALDERRIAMTEPGNPRSRNQRYYKLRS